jgi:cysteinyl-tRNA synthetase
MSLPRVRLYNTFGRKVEEIQPAQEGVVRIYSCGPTVYRYVHVGNLRTFMLPDLLCRTLEYLGYRTEQVMNITDVGHLTDDTFDRGEDKMLVAARLENKSAEEIAAYYTGAFMEDAAKLNIRPAAHYPHATQYIPQMIELVTKLLEKGHAYVVGGNVYFDIATFPAYGGLSRNTTEKLLAGARGDVDTQKHHPADFTLWKAAGEHRMQVWPSPWGPGFPGWHIECSAMSMSLLGERFDIHTGGADNVFPHHEAEIAQSEGVTGHRVVSTWMHGGLLLMSGARMAKSAGNFFRITVLEEQGFDPLAFRYLALQAKYRTKLNFSTKVWRVRTGHCASSESASRNGQTIVRTVKNELAIRGMSASGRRSPTTSTFRRPWRWSPTSCGLRCLLWLKPASSDLGIACSAWTSTGCRGSLYPRACHSFLKRARKHVRRRTSRLRTGCVMSSPGRGSRSPIRPTGRSGK